MQAKAPDALSRHLQASPDNDKLDAALLGEVNKVLSKLRWLAFLSPSGRVEGPLYAV